MASMLRLLLRRASPLPRRPSRGCVSWRPGAGPRALATAPRAAAAAEPAPPSPEPSASDQGARVLERTLKVRPQGRLTLEIGGDARHGVVNLKTENQHCDFVEFRVEAKDVEQIQFEPDGEGGVRLVVPESEGLNISGLIPEKFNVDAVTNGAALTCSRLEGSLSIESQGGTIELDKVNEGPINIDSGGGNVSCRVINGDARVRTNGGAFTSKRVSGINFDVKTGGGDVDIRALYATHIQINGGSLTCGSLHGNATLKTSAGDIVVESGLDGNVDVQSKGGKVDLQLGSSAEKVFVHTEGGDAHIRLPQDLEAKIEALGKRGVLIDEALKDSVGYADVNCQVASGRVMAKGTTSGARGYTPKQAMIRVDAATGFVELRGKDWLSSLGSKFQKLKDI